MKVLALQIPLLSLVCWTTLASEHHKLRGDFECTELFVELDENRDGVLTKTDLATYLHAQEGLSHLEVDDYLSDVDPRASLGFDEFCRKNKNSYEEWKQQKADHKKKKALKKATEFLTYNVVAQVSSGSCRDVFNTLDVDNDQSLDRDDVTQAFTTASPSSDIESLVNDFFANNPSETMTYSQFQAEFCEASNVSARQEVTEESSSSSTEESSSSSTETRSSSTRSYRQSNSDSETPSRDTPSRDTPSRDTPSRDTPSRNSPSTPSRDTPSRDSPSRDSPSRNSPSRGSGGGGMGMGMKVRYQAYHWGH